MKKLKIRPFMIFNGKYENSLMDREGVTNTYELMSEIMFNEETLNFDLSQSVVIQNGRRADVFKKLRAFAESIDVSSEMLLFYFCGHGCPDYQDNKLYLAMYDTDFEHVSDNGIAAEAINSIIQDYKIRYYAIILDCCHADMYSMGNTDKVIKSISLNDYSELKGGFFIPTSEANQCIETRAINGKQYLPFTYYFFKILGEGIKNEFKSISFKEIYEKVKKNLSSMNINLPVIEQKGDLFQVALWENLKYKNVGHEYIPQEAEHTLKVLLVKSSIYHPIKNDDFGVPLGLWVLKDYIEKYGMDVQIEIYDERLELQRKGDNPNTKEKVRSAFADIINEYDVIGISMSSSEVGPAIEKFKIAKKLGKITMAGGIFTSSNEQYLLDTKVVDYVIPSIGTTALRKLLEWLVRQKRIKLNKEAEGKKYNIEINNEILGVATRDNLQEFFVPTDVGLSNMSFGIWEKIIDRYKPFLFDEELQVYKMDIFSSRGCKGTCVFCSVQKECGRQIITRSRESLINEVKNLYSNDFRYFSLKDEDCLVDEDGFFQMIKKLQLPDIKFKIRTRVDRLLDKKDRLQELASLGVMEIQYGIESSDQALLRNIKKGIKNKQFDKIKQFIKSHADVGIIANCSFILGLSGETDEYYDELWGFIKEIYDYPSIYKPKIYINFLTPHPRSSAFPIGQDYKMITNDLNYFTHKYPIGFYELEDGAGFATREKMIDTYEKIIEYTNSTKYNPSLKNEQKYEYIEEFIVGNKYVLNNPQLPNYCEGE